MLNIKSRYIRETIFGFVSKISCKPRSCRGCQQDERRTTYFDAPRSSECWVGMDFGEPVQMKNVSFEARSDGNNIVVGNEYELVYRDNNQWISLGKQRAKHVHLLYKNCPKNALFLLHNRTTGIQERIFTYENGKQVWW